MSTHLPHLKDIRDLLVDLLGRDVTLNPGPPMVPTPKAPVSMALYVDDTLTIRSLIMCDLQFSAGAGSAIGLIPVDAATAAIEAGVLTDPMQENLYEVLNIAASLFNVGDATHLRLYQMHHIGPPLPPELVVSAVTLGRREDLEMEIAGYGKGRFSVVLLA